MKMNKKGFTLIELLAVIVILAVIALIAVPRIIELLNNARKSAAEDSTYGILEAAESYLATYMLKNQGDFPEKVTFTCTTEKKCTGDDTESTILSFKGTKPTGGKIEVTAAGGAKIAEALTINGFTCNYASEGSDVITCDTSAS